MASRVMDLLGKARSGPHVSVSVAQWLATFEPATPISEVLESERGAERSFAHASELARYVNDRLSLEGGR